MRKKTLCALLVVCLSVSLFVGCNNSTMYELSYYDEMNTAKGYDENLFYENDMEAACADPTAIYITDKNDPDYGWFYMYPTSDSDFGCHGFSAYKSRDLKSWQYVGPVFDPKEESWSHFSCWAPECIYDAETGKYYLFYSSTDYYNALSTPGRANNDGYTFINNDEKKYYRGIEADINAIVGDNKKTTKEKINVLDSAIDELKKFYEGVTADVEASNGRTYTQGQITDALNQIANLDKTVTDESQRLNDARTCLLKAKTVDVQKMFTSQDFGIGVAVSDSPRGPFTQYTNVKDEEGYDENNREITIDLPFLASEDVYYWLHDHRSEWYKGPDTPEQNPGQMTNVESCAPMIDVHPFVDPVSGEKYLYMVRDPNGGGPGFIFVMKMGKKWTDDPKWDTATRLTRFGYYTTDDLSSSNKSSDLIEGTIINEGPYVYYNKDSNKYYLTLSVNSYNKRSYSVVQAIGDSPLGPFRKLSRAEGGTVVATDFDWDHVSGPGHHSFVTFNDNLYIVYHAHYKRVTGGDQRGSCVDEVVWTKNAQGETIMHCNGPTYSYQPKIGPDAEYKNIATQAKITATNVAEDSDVSLLNDRLIRFFTWDEYLKEFTTGSKKETKITLTFDDYVATRALMVYNSWDYSLHWEKIDRVEMDFVKTVDGKEVTGTAYIDNLKFDTERHIGYNSDEQYNFMRPGGAAIAEYDELKVKEIRLTFKHDAPIAISEIYVLGK